MGKQKHPYRDRVTQQLQMRLRALMPIFTALLFLLACPMLLAGGGRHNVLVVVNDNSQVSRAIGEYYRAARKIPAANVCHIECSTGEIIDSAELKEKILYPVENYLTANGLVEQIRYIVLTKGVPLRVSSTGSSVDGALTLAFQRWSDGITPCIEGAGSSYLGQESDFAAFRASEANRIEIGPPGPLCDIAPRGDGTVFAVGGHFIARSANGIDWEQMPEGGYPSILTTLNRAYFFDIRTGWAVGEHDTILSTTDGGDTWQRVRGGLSSPKVSLSGVWFISANDGWAVGKDENGGPLVLRSSDGGINWAPQPTGAASPLNDIFFTDVRHGWIVGDSDMLRTTDGGETWAPARNGVPAGSINRIFFTDREVGWVIGGSGLLCRTTDGGATWTQQVIGGMFGQALLDCHFIDRNTGWIVTSSSYDDPELGMWSARLMRTTDGGAHWTTLQSGEYDKPAVYFSDAQTGFYAQQVSDEEPWSEVIYRTTDGGATKTRSYVSPPWSIKIMYLVCRLDSYGTDVRGGGNGVPDDIEGMISGSLSPDTTGRFVFDAAPGNAAAGNSSLADAADQLLARGKSVLLDEGTTFITGAYPGLGAVAGYAGWGSNDWGAKWNTEWAKPNFTWKPGSIAMCYVSTDGRSFRDPPAYLDCGANLIADEGGTYDDPGLIRIQGGVFVGWVGKIHGADGRVVSSAAFSLGSIYVPCPAPVEGYIQVYRPDGVTPICGGRFPASGTAMLTGGKAYRFYSSQSLIADYLSEGCSGAIGSVTEPGFGWTFPEYTFPRYADGFTWAESAYMGIGILAYTFIAAGDPLMAPYATPPSVAFVSPAADGDRLSGTARVEVTASDAQGIGGVELWIDDRFCGRMSGSGPAYGIEIDTRLLDDGPHTLEAIACEAGGAATQGSVFRTITIAHSEADSVADLLDVPEATWVSLELGFVSRSFPSDNCFYVQEGTTAGIRVVSSRKPAEGSTVRVTGVLHTGGGDERWIEAEAVTVTSAGGAAPRPLGMSNKSLGGRSMGTASGISKRSKPAGLYNIGLLVETWGRITSVGADGFFISDGSDGDVKVRCRGFAPPPYRPGDYVKVTGISSLDAGNRALLVNRASDIQLVGGP